MYECKNYQMCKENFSWNPSTCICKNGKYLGSSNDNSVIRCGKIISAVGNVSATVSSTVSTNFCNKKVRYKMDFYILLTVFLVIILLFIIAIICYYYAKHRSKQKNVLLY